MVIRNGSVYWVDFSPGKGSEPKGRRPGLVLQSNILNESKLNTVLMVAITSTLKFGDLPSNVVLKKGESGLPKRCVINVTQIKSVDKKSIKEKIGSLSKKKLDQVHSGGDVMVSVRTRVFKNNRSQAVRLPKAIAFPESVKDVEITAIGNK